jgi:hypothetical protein
MNAHLIFEQPLPFESLGMWIKTETKRCSFFDSLIEYEIELKFVLILRQSDNMHES